MAAEKGIAVAGASGRDAGTVPAVTSDATLSTLAAFGLLFNDSIHASMPIKAY